MVYYFLFAGGLVCCYYLLELLRFGAAVGLGGWRFWFLIGVRVGCLCFRILLFWCCDCGSGAGGLARFRGLVVWVAVFGVCCGCGYLVLLVLGCCLVVNGICNCVCFWS